MTADDRELLIRIDTKLTVVCGENGDGGVLAKHDQRIRSLEDDRTAREGAISQQQRTRHAAFALWSTVSGGVVWVADHLPHWLGRN